MLALVPAQLLQLDFATPAVRFCSPRQLAVAPLIQLPFASAQSRH